MDLFTVISQISIGCMFYCVFVSECAGVKFKASHVIMFLTCEHICIQLHGSLFVKTFHNNADNKGKESTKISV